MRVLAALLFLLEPSHAASVCGPIRALVRAAAQQQKIPAISAAIVQNSRVACSISLGWADLEQRVPNTPSSLHRLASLSKPVTAVLTMKLVEEKKLALDDSARRFLPALPDGYDGVTLRRLLCHQSGIREYANPDEVFSAKHYAGLHDALAIFVGSPLLFPPGSKTAYTTYGYTLLGAVLEQVTGERFDQLIRKELSGFLVDDFNAVIPGRVRPYRSKSDGTWENAPAFDPSNKYPGGGLLSSAEEYAKFLIAVSSGRIIRRESVTEMWTQQRLSDGSTVPFATLGWATGMRNGHRFFTHGGLQPGTTTVMHIFPDLRTGSVILCNAEGPALDRLQESILDLLVTGTGESTR